MAAPVTDALTLHFCQEAALAVLLDPVDKLRDGLVQTRKSVAAWGWGSAKGTEGWKKPTFKQRVLRS